MPLSKELQNKIYDFIKSKILIKINGYSLDEEDAHKPFQYALFTKKGYLAKGFIHGCETALGNWHESIAKIVAEDNFKVARKLQNKEKLEGEITHSAQKKIDNILSDLDSAIREPNSKKEADEIYSVSQDSGKEKRIQTIDLYLERDNGEEIYFEMKGPKPNKNEMKAAKKDLLDIYAMKAAEGKKVKIFLGMYYNPYFPKEYQRWTCLKFFEKGGDLLVGKDFWDFLGGKNSYEKLIEIYEKIGEEIRPALDKKFKAISKDIK